MTLGYSIRIGSGVTLLPPCVLLLIQGPVHGSVLVSVLSSTTALTTQSHDLRKSRDGTPGPLPDPRYTTLGDSNRRKVPLHFSSSLLGVG